MLQKRFGLDCNLHLKVLVEGSYIPYEKPKIYTLEFEFEILFY